jgi:hypothetical protein
MPSGTPELTNSRGWNWNCSMCCPVRNIAVHKGGLNEDRLKIYQVTRETYKMFSGDRTYTPSVYLKRFLSPLNSDRALSSPPALMSLNLLRNICTRSKVENERRNSITTLTRREKEALLTYVL